MIRVERTTPIGKLNLKLNLRVYVIIDRDPYTLVSGTIKVSALTAGRGNNNKQVVLKNCVPFTDCISEMNNTQVDNAKHWSSNA